MEKHFKVLVYALTVLTLISCGEDQSCEDLENILEDGFFTGIISECEPNELPLTQIMCEVRTSISSEKLNIHLIVESKSLDTTMIYSYECEKTNEGNNRINFVENNLNIGRLSFGTNIDFLFEAYCEGQFFQGIIQDN